MPSSLARIASRPIALHDVAQVEIDHVPAADAELHFGADLEDFAGGDVARDEVAVFGIALFEEVESLGFGDVVGARGVSPRLVAAPRRGRLRRGRIR